MCSLCGIAIMMSPCPIQSPAQEVVEVQKCTGDATWGWPGLSWEPSPVKVALSSLAAHLVTGP